jgi:hypothetical protein
MQCPLEPQFNELYEVLGDKAAQDAIRKANPTEQHCPKLRANPKACINCDNNPHENPKLRKQTECLEKYGYLLEDGKRLLNLSELGFLRDLDQLTPEGYLVLTIMHETKAQKRMMDQAEYFAVKMSALFGKKG